MTKFKKFLKGFATTTFIFLTCWLASADVAVAAAQQQMLLSANSSAVTSIITSIQPVTITIPTTATTATATITSVNTSLSVVFFNGIITNNTGTVTQHTDLASVALTNATTVTATRGVTSATFTTTVKATVVSYSAAAINSIQIGTITLGNAVTSNTGTITSVTTTNAAVLLNGYTTSAATGSVASQLLSVALTNGTTVTAQRGGTNGSTSATVHYTVLEFKPGILNSSAQRGTIAVTASTNTATITSVATANSMLVWGGTSSTDTTNAGWGASLYLTLTNGTTVTATANGTITGGTTSTAYYTILEFTPAYINSVNRGIITIALSTTSNTATITAVNTALSLANFTGWSAESGAANANDNLCFTNLALTNATTVTAARNTTTASFTANQGWEVISFK